MLCLKKVYKSILITSKSIFTSASDNYQVRHGLSLPWFEYSVVCDLPFLQ